jgi:ribokinase
MNKIFVMGSLNMDLSISSDVFPKEGETLIGYNFITNPGGKGANQAVAASKLGAKVIMLGAVGNDFYGKELIKNLAKNKIKTKYVKTIDGSTGVAVIVVNKGQNRIILDSGVNFKYDFEDYKNILKKEAKTGDYFITQLETKIENVVKGINFAKQLGLITIFNPAPAYELPLDIYKSIDYLICNETEAFILTDISPDNEQNILKIMEKFINLGVKNVIITLGKNGSVYFDKGIQYIPAIDVKVVDTTGAGDTYIGAVAVELKKGSKLPSTREVSKFLNINPFMLTKIKK